MLDLDVGFLSHGEFLRQRLASDADAGNVQLLGDRVVEADAAEVYREAIFQAANHDLKNALRILPLANRARGLVEQIQALQLRLEFALSPLVLCDFGFQGFNRPGEILCSALHAPVKLIISLMQELSPAPLSSISSL